MAKVLYELEPIGVDGQLEAAAVLPFCSEACRENYKVPTWQTVGKGENSDFLPGTVCETCGYPLPPEAEA